MSILQRLEDNALDEESPKVDKKMTRRALLGRVGKGLALAGILGGIGYVGYDRYESKLNDAESFDPSLYQKAELKDILLNIHGINNTKNYRGKFVEFNIDSKKSSHQYFPP